jgi:uncharacterized protein YbdZ (MbtH family)
MKKHNNRFGRTLFVLAVVMTWLFAGISPATAQEDKYEVVQNPEEQYSIWPLGKPLPLGWHLVGKTGTKEECLNYIKETSTDMRPLSLRKKKETEETKPAPPPSGPDTTKEKSLIEKLSGGDHPIQVGFADGVVNMRDALSRGYVNIQFLETKNEMGDVDTLQMNLDKAACNFDKVDFEKGKGPVHLEGTVTVEGKKVRCIADFDVAKLYGGGHLVAAKLR